MWNWGSGQNVPKTNVSCGPIKHDQPRMFDPDLLTQGSWDGPQHGTVSSISNRSLRTVYNTCNNKARNNFSGAIDGRPVAAYIAVNFLESSFNTRSVIFRIDRSG